MQRSFRLQARDGCVVITADLDFPRLLGKLGSPGPGLILLRGGNYSDAQSRDCVRRVLMSIAHPELPRSIAWSTAKESSEVGFLCKSSGSNAILLSS